MIDITLQELKIFELLLQTGSIERVAEILQISRPTCTRGIASLEEKLGIPLFLRINNEFKLTTDAIRFYEPCFRLLQSSYNIFSKRQQTPEKLKIGLPILASYVFSFYLLPLLTKQIGVIPDIELTTFTLADFQILPEYMPLMLRNMDIVILEASYEDYLDPSVWKKHYQYDSKIKLYSSKSYLDQAPELHAPCDLLKHRCIGYKNYLNDHWNWQFCDENNQNIQVPVKPDIIIDTEIMQGYAVASGWGIAQISEDVVKSLNELTHTEIIEVLLPYKIHNRAIAIYANHSKTHPLQSQLLEVLQNLHQLWQNSEPIQ